MKHANLPLKKIKNITVAIEMRAENHIANGGDGITTNMSSVKMDNLGRAYISGARCRTALAHSMRELNDDPNTYVSNGDGVTGDICTDLRSDLLGFMMPEGGAMANRRTSPVSCNHAVAQDKSMINVDVFSRNSEDNSEPDRGSDGKNKKPNRQMYGHRQVSVMDFMTLTFGLNVPMVGAVVEPKYEKGKHLQSELISKIDHNERIRRTKLFLEGTRSLSFSNQARNAFCAEPERVLIVLDPKLSRKAERYWRNETSDRWRKNFLAELDERGAIYFIGDDHAESGMSVHQAYSAVSEIIDSNPDALLHAYQNESSRNNSPKVKAISKKK